MIHRKKEKRFVAQTGMKYWETFNEYKREQIISNDSPRPNLLNSKYKSLPDSFKENEQYLVSDYEGELENLLW